MLVIIRFHRANQADIVHALAQVREQVTDERSGFSAGTELPTWLEQNTLLIGETASDTDRFPVSGEKLRLKVERVHVRHATVGKDENNALRARRVMRHPRCERVGCGFGKQLR